MVSLHTSPLAPLGRTRDAGGMNAYIRGLARELSRDGMYVDIFTRRSQTTTPDIEQLGERIRLIHLTAGPVIALPPNDLFPYVGEFTRQLARFAEEDEQARHGYDMLHTHYWLSAAAALPLAREWDIPHVTMFHTVERLKGRQAASGVCGVCGVCGMGAVGAASAAQLSAPLSPAQLTRIEYEERIADQVDRIIVSTEHEGEQLRRLYGLPACRFCVIPCGVDLAAFTPGALPTRRARLADATPSTRLADVVADANVGIRTRATASADAREAIPARTQTNGARQVSRVGHARTVNVPRMTDADAVVEAPDDCPVEADQSALARARAEARQTIIARHDLSDAPILLFVGRLDPIKGIDLLLESAAQLRTLAQVIVIGGDPTAPNGDPEIARLRTRADELGILDRVRFPGAVAQDALPTYYRAADALVVTSRYESFGLVAVEALACGTPVIAARVGGLPSIVREGENGLFASWRSPSAFAERIDELLANDALRAHLRAQARHSVERFDWPRIGDRVRALYADLATERHCAACSCF